jgi:hypothetical protein
MDELIESMIDMITPVMEGAMITAAHYAKACGRNTVTATDMKYGMRFCAQNVAGKQIGTMFPELQDQEDDASDIEEVDEDEEPFTRYSGDDELMNKVNKAYDEWDTWEPFSPLEKLIKTAVDQSG